MADPAGRNGGSKWKRAQPARTLKTAQGKTFREAIFVEDSSQKRRLWNSQIRLQPFLNSLRNAVAVEARSSEKERSVDAKALIADEGRDKLR